MTDNLTKRVKDGPASTQYAERDAMALDKAGGYYWRHLNAMTAEGLRSKADIAAELAWRDMKIDRLEAARLEALRERDEALAECRAAADYTDKSPCDPDIYAEQLAAWIIYQPMLKARLASAPRDAAFE